MLKYGVNLLQAIGNFNGISWTRKFCLFIKPSTSSFSFASETCTGPYIIVIAVMCVVPTSGTPQLQDYVQPVVASGDTGKRIHR